ncbi:restriction endonuclease subunit S [Acinetobacter pollinis]|uniref:Restriction endonuclease subunit S n=1 Tax=Acinetobacter pollinis TaxID=2605270 RepID=A0ABU6DQK5_9GAMM|nr:restriction endonuclease subunit S [Acinetobacter pollinis]MEB5475688.1 restriction endonuclease subunit S [Acinetobacter pollinis]
MEKKTCPELRFKGFDQDWSIILLGNLMNVGSVKRVHQADWCDTGVRFLRARDIVAFAKNEDIADPIYISQDRYEEYSKLSGKVKVGDLLVTGVGTIGIPLLVKKDDPLYFKDGNVIWFKNDNVINGLFLYYSFINDITQNFIRDSSGIGTVGTYTITSGKQTPIYLPKENEQAQIGHFFENLDQSIALHEKKLAQTQNLKKAMLEKMFPKVGSKQPEIRLKGFSGDWELSYLDNILESLPNNTLSRADLNYSKGEIKSIHYGDILIKYGVIIDCEVDEIPFITDCQIADFKSHKLKNGDIIFADTAEDDAVGKAVELRDINDLFIVSGLHTMAYRPKIKLSPNYLGYYLNTQSYRRQLSVLMQGVKVLSISKKNLSKTQVLYPSSEQEQQKIGEYFKTLDQTLTLRQQQLQTLKKLKQAFLEKMFV